MTYWITNNSKFNVVEFFLKFKYPVRKYYLDPPLQWLAPLVVIVIARRIVLITFNVFIGGGRRRFDHVHQKETVPLDEIDGELCGHRLGGLGDLPESIPGEHLHRRLLLSAGQGDQADQPRDHTEPGQDIRPVLGNPRTVLRARKVGPRHVALHGSLRTRAPKKLPQHEGVDLRVQLMSCTPPPPPEIFSFPHPSRWNQQFISE